MGEGKLSNFYHIVELGENLESIAFKYGFTSRFIWDLPENAELKKFRNDCCVLAVGDKVFIPALREKSEMGETNQVHKFKCKNTPSLFRFRPLVFGEPLTKENYELSVDGSPPIRGVVGDDGTINHLIKPDAREAKLTVGEGVGEIRYEINLRTLQPANEIQGVQIRLNQLGHYIGPLDGKESAETKDAIAMFQERQGLEPTGIVDDSTKDRLLKQHGR